MSPRPHDREAEQAQQRLNAERAEQRRPDLQSIELTEDEIPKLVQLNPAAVAAEERAKRELLAAMRMPVEKKPAPREAQDRTDGKTQRTEPASVPASKPAPEPVVIHDAAVAMSEDLVTKALAEQALCLAVAEDAKAMLEGANLRVVQARQESAGVKHQQAVADAQRKLTPLAAKVTRLRDALQAIHNEHNGTLKTYAMSNASGDLVTRTKVQAIYSAAAPLQQKVARAFKACEEALRFVAAVPDAGQDSLSWAVERAEQACATALQVSAAQLRAEVESLITQFTALRGTPTVVVRLMPQREEDRNPGSETGWDHNVNA